LLIYEYITFNFSYYCHNNKIYAGSSLFSLHLQSICKKNWIIFGIKIINPHNKKAHMGNIRRHFSLNNVVMALTIGSFAPVAALPPVNPVQMNVNLNDIAFGVQLIKLADKGKDLLDKMKKKDEMTERNSKKLVDVMFDLKDTISGYTGIHIDIDKQVDHTVNELKKEGTKLSKEQVKDIKKVFKHKNKKHSHKALFMADCMNYGVEYTPENEAIWEDTYLDYNMRYCAVQDAMIFTAKSAKHGGEKEKEIVVPLKLVVGITGALCGFFVALVPLPIPGKMQVATFLITTGLKYSCDAVIEACEDRQKKDQP
jgi:hypothetical protein